jgi:hypothetical protein
MSEKITFTDNGAEIIFKQGVSPLQRPQAIRTMDYQAVPPPPAHQFFLSNSVPLPPANLDISTSDEVIMINAAMHHLTNQLRTDKLTMMSSLGYRLEPRIDDHGMSMSN